MKRLIPLFLALVLLILPIQASASDVVSYTADFYVADYADVLDDEVEGLIVLNNDVLDKACGAQIVVVTVDSVGESTIENYAYALFNEWGIGDKAKNNGLLILLAIQDGQYWLMPGKGLQDYLPAGDLDEMATEYLLPSAQAGNYSEGVRQLFGACFDYVSVAYDAGVTLDETLYYTWLQTGSTGEGGSQYLQTPVREMTATAEPESVVEFEPEPQPAYDSRGNEGGFGFMHIIVILIVLIVIFSNVGRVRRIRPGRGAVPRRQVPPPPPMGGFRPTPPPAAPRRAPMNPRPPMGGMSGSRPARRPSSGSFGGSVGGGFARPSSGSRPSSRSSGGFGGGRSGGGGASRGGGSGGSFRGGR